MVSRFNLALPAWLPLYQGIIPVLLGCICQLVVKQYSSAIYDFDPITMNLGDYEDPITYAHASEYLSIFPTFA